MLPRITISLATVPPGITERLLLTQSATSALSDIKSAWLTSPYTSPGSHSWDLKMHNEICWWLTWSKLWLIVTVEISGDDGDKICYVTARELSCYANIIPIWGVFGEWRLQPSVTYNQLVINLSSFRINWQLDRLVLRRCREVIQGGIFTHSRGTGGIWNYPYHLSVLFATLAFEIMNSCRQFGWREVHFTTLPHGTAEALQWVKELRTGLFGKGAAAGMIAPRWAKGLMGIFLVQRRSNTYFTNFVHSENIEHKGRTNGSVRHEL